MVLRDRKAFRDQLVLKVCKASKGQPVLRARKAFRDSQDRQGNQDLAAMPAPWDYKDRVAKWARLVHEVPPAHPDPRDRKDRAANWVP